MCAKSVVILGAGWAGLPLAHKLLKYTTPKVDIKVILVTPNTHFYWNVAATRGILPDAISDEDLFIPIAPAFQHHLAAKFELVLGRAESVIPEDNAVIIRMNDGSQRKQDFNQLVIATGSRLSSGLPLKPLDSHEETIQALHILRANIDGAKTVLISGAGTTGVEVAGELAAKYGSKKSVCLVMSGDAPLDAQKGVLSSVKDTLSHDLKKLGVKVLRQTRVLSTKEVGGKTEVQLSNGSSITVDCYLPLHGMSLNLSFVPKDFLGSAGEGLNLDPRMRVRGMKNIWGIGDVGNTEPKQLVVIDNQIIYLSGALHKVLIGDENALQPYKPMDKTMVFLALGQKHATGQVGTWRLWGFLVSYVKGRKLFVDTARGYVEGKHLRHASM